MIRQLGKTKIDKYSSGQIYIWQPRVLEIFVIFVFPIDNVCLFLDGHEIHSIMQ